MNVKKRELTEALLLEEIQGWLSSPAFEDDSSPWHPNDIEDCLDRAQSLLKEIMTGEDKKGELLVAQSLRDKIIQALIMAQSFIEHKESQQKNV